MMFAMRIENVTRKGNSRNGNPRFLVALTDHNGFTQEVYTKPDAMFAFLVGNAGLSTGDYVWVEFNQSYITDMQPYGE